MISMEIFGVPVPQARPRMSSRHGRTQVFDSQKSLKEGLQWQIRSLFRGDPLLIPVALDLVFFMPIPKSTSKLRTRQMENGLIAHTKKPDLDNLQKFVLDGMNGIVFKDDSQVTEIRAKKIYASKPGTLIRVIPLADEKREILYENCTRKL